MTNSLASPVTPADPRTAPYPVLSEEEFAKVMAILDRKAALTGWDGYDEDLPEGWDDGLER